jgi:hypothetical protein
MNDGELRVKGRIREGDRDRQNLSRRLNRSILLVCTLTFVLLVSKYMYYNV